MGAVDSIPPVPNLPRDTQRFSYQWVRHVSAVPDAQSSLDRRNPYRSVSDDPKAQPQRANRRVKAAATAASEHASSRPDSLAPFVFRVLVGTRGWIQSASPVGGGQRILRSSLHLAIRSRPKPPGSVEVPASQSRQRVGGFRTGHFPRRGWEAGGTHSETPSEFHRSDGKVPHPL